MTVDYPHNIVHDTPHTMRVRMQVLHTIRGKEAKPLYPYLGVWYVHMLRVSALHYLAGDRVLEGFQMVASAHVLCQPTSCGSKYFYSQCPQVQNLIGTERSLNRSEHRVKKEAS